MIAAMINPFDRDFFKFTLGFMLVIAAGLTVLYLIGAFSTGIR